MKSLYTSRRPAVMFFVGAVIVIIAIIGCALFILQTKTKQVNNVSELFQTESVLQRPSISIDKIDQPVSELSAPSVAKVGAGVPVSSVSVAAAQSQMVGSRVTYPSLQITGMQRDRLLIVAASIVLIGLSLYSMTMITIAPRIVPVTRRPLYKVMDM